MIKLLHLLSVIVFSTINRSEGAETTSIYEALRAYYDSGTHQNFKDEWKKYRSAFENEIASNLRENFGEKALNIYEPDKHVAHLIAKGFHLTDGVVSVFLQEMILRELPELLRPKLDMDLPNNFVRFKSKIGRMFVDTTYYVARNSSAIIYARPEDQKHMSPFSLQQVDSLGKLVIIAEDCTLSGISIAALSGDSVSLGHSPFRLYDCKFMVEISTPKSGAPPVIAPYFPSGPKETLELIIANPIREELHTKLQGAMYSYINTSVLFGNQATDFRNNQQKLLTAYHLFVMNYIANLNRATTKANKAHVPLHSFEVTMDTEHNKKRTQCHIELRNISMYGMDTAYATRTGGPYNDGSFETAADSIVFSSIQIRGTISHDEGVCAMYHFSAELTDVSVTIGVVIEEGNTKLQQINFTGWRSLEYSMIPRVTEYKERREHESLVYGHILNELPVLVLNHLTSVLGDGSTNKNTQPGGGDASGDASGGGNESGGGGGGGGGGSGGGGGGSGEEGGNSSIDDEEKNKPDDTKHKKGFLSDHFLDEKFFSDDPIDKDFLDKDFLDKDFFTDDKDEKDKHFFSDDNKQLNDKIASNVKNRPDDANNDDITSNTEGDVGKNIKGTGDDEEEHIDNKTVEKRGSKGDQVNDDSKDTVSSDVKAVTVDDTVLEKDDKSVTESTGGDVLSDNGTDKEGINDDDEKSPIKDEVENIKSPGRMGASQNGGSSNFFSDHFLEKGFFSDDKNEDFFSDNESEKKGPSEKNDLVDNENQESDEDDNVEENKPSIDENIEENEEEAEADNNGDDNENEQEDFNKVKNEDEANISGNSNEQQTKGSSSGDDVVKERQEEDDGNEDDADEDKIPNIDNDEENDKIDKDGNKVIDSSDKFDDSVEKKILPDYPLDKDFLDKDFLDKDFLDKDFIKDEIKDSEAEEKGNDDDDEGDNDKGAENVIEDDSKNGDGDDEIEDDRGGDANGDVIEDDTKSRDEDGADEIEDQSKDEDADDDGVDKIVEKGDEKKIGDDDNRDKPFFSDDFLDKDFLDKDFLDKNFFSDDGQKLGFDSDHYMDTEKGLEIENGDGDNSNEDEVHKIKHLPYPSKDGQKASNKKLFVFASKEALSAPRDPAKSFFDDKFFSDEVLDRRSMVNGSRRHAEKQNKTANIKDPRNGKDDNINVSKRENVGVQSTTKENITEKVKDSRNTTKGVLPPNVHNARRQSNVHVSDNEIR